MPLTPATSKIHNVEEFAKMKRGVIDKEPLVRAFDAGIVAQILSYRSSDTVCPWCYVGKKHLDKDIAFSNKEYDFEIKWHPFQLNPSAPKEGIDKREYYKSKIGARSESIISRMTEMSYYGE